MPEYIYLHTHAGLVDRKLEGKKKKEKIKEGGKE